MCGRERPMGAAKGKQTNTVALVPNRSTPPPPQAWCSHPPPGETVQFAASGGAFANRVQWPRTPPVNPIRIECRRGPIEWRWDWATPSCSCSAVQR